MHRCLPVVFFSFTHCIVCPFWLTLLITPLSRNESGRFGALKSDSTHHFIRNACTQSGSLRFRQFSGCWLILSVYIIMSFDFSFVRLFGVRQFCYYRYFVFSTVCYINLKLVYVNIWIMTIYYSLIYYGSMKVEFSNKMYVLQFLWS